jgi:hypothetical protein
MTRAIQIAVAIVACPVALVVAAKVTVRVLLGVHG